MYDSYCGGNEGSSITLDTCLPATPRHDEQHKAKTNEYNKESK